MVDEDEIKEQSETITHSEPDADNPETTNSETANSEDTVSLSKELDPVSKKLDPVSLSKDTVSVSKGLDPVSKGLDTVSKGLDTVSLSKELQNEKKTDKLYQLFKRFIGSAAKTPELKEELIKIIEKPQCYEDCFYCRKVVQTTQESKYTVSPHISEFWAAVTSPFYHVVFFTLFIPISQWWLGWRKNDGYPKQLLITIYLCIALGVFSIIYHTTMSLYIGCLDCGFAIITWSALLLSIFGVRIEIYLTVIFILICVFIIFLQKSVAIAAITGAFLLPLTFYAGIKGGTMFSYLSGICIGLGSICFFADRTKLINFKYLHPLWHMLGGASQLFSALHVLIHGPIHNVSTYLPVTDDVPVIYPMPVKHGSMPYLHDFSDVIA